MESSSDCQLVLKKISEYNRLSTTDSDEKIKNSIQEMLHLWPEVLAAGDQATDDELFTLNVSRAVLTQVFAIALSKDFFNKDRSLIREIFFACFNILLNHTDIFRDNTSVFINSNVRLLMKMSSSLSSSVHFHHDDLSTTEDRQLLIAMREHIDQDSKHDNLTDGIISLIWNLSDQTILVPVLLDTGYGKSVVQWIENRQMKFREDKLDAPIHILHNLSRHDDGIDELNTYDAVKVLEEVQIDSNVCDDADDMAIHIAMVRALLTDIEQIKRDTNKYPNKVVNILLQLSMDAAKNDRHRHNGSHVSEPLTVLVKLFYNDEILENTLSNNDAQSSVNIRSIVELFASLLKKFYPKINVETERLESYTCVVILNLFWLISNHEKYRQAISDHQQLMEIVTSAENDEQCFTDTFMPRTMKSIKQTAEGILRNLNIRN